MKNVALCLALLFAGTLSAQKMMTRNGFVKFYSDGAVEDIEAKNKQVSSIVNLSDGQFAFSVPIKGFVFEKALMQEHFNENYMESGEYPNGTFKGSLTGYESIDLTKDGTYDLTMEGTMNIHGTDRKISEPVKITVKGGKIELTSTFNLKPEDYGIKIPAAKKDNIASTLELTVKMNYEKK